MRIFPSQIRRAAGPTVAAGLAGAAVWAVVANYTRPDYTAFESAFWNQRAIYAGDQIALRRPRPENLDIRTPKGWSGKIRIDQPDDRLVMDLVDRQGNAIPGLFVTARVRDHTGRRIAAHRVLSQDADGVYRSNALGLGKGRWDIVLRADDPASRNGTELLFRVEKRISTD